MKRAEHPWPADGYYVYSARRDTNVGKFIADGKPLGSIQGTRNGHYFGYGIYAGSFDVAYRYWERLESKKGGKHSIYQIHLRTPARLILDKPDLHDGVIFSDQEVPDVYCGFEVWEGPILNGPLGQNRVELQVILPYNMVRKEDIRTVKLENTDLIAEIRAQFKQHFADHLFIAGSDRSTWRNQPLSALVERRTAFETTIFSEERRHMVQALTNGSDLAASLEHAPDHRLPGAAPHYRLGCILAFKDLDRVAEADGYPQDLLKSIWPFGSGDNYGAYKV